MKVKDKNILDASPMPLEQFLSFGILVSNTLYDLHKNGYIHGTICPENISWESSCHKVMLVNPSSGRMGLSLFHTPHLPYISPEQTGRMNRKVDYRTDLYSLGICFYELLTGTPPFTTEDTLELIHCHIAKRPNPPHHIKTKIPDQISAIVMRLLEKNPEDRYQSASGLLHDLKRSAEQLDKSGSIERFELGEADFIGIFQIPQKLYGREKEIELLLDSFNRISTGTMELIFVTGYSGTGKTALIHEIQKPIVEKRGHFIEGKFEQFRRNTPYSAWIQAFSGMMNYLLMSESKELAEWKQKMVEAIGVNGKVLIDLIPALGLIVGEQPDVPKLDGYEAQNRFNYVFQNFVRAIAQKKHPIVIFLDDLQWADVASLSLLKTLVTDPKLAYVLVIGAYREEEVDATHHLMMNVLELQRANVNPKYLTIQNLSDMDINAMISDTLHCSKSEAHPLSRLVYRKNSGNAFFCHQILHSMNENNLLNFDQKSHRWQWDKNRLEALDVTDNVIDLLLKKIDKLPHVTQEILKRASCIGNEIQRDLMHCIISDFAPTPEKEIKVLLRESIVLPGPTKYRFAHDRIQQACYCLIPQKEKPSYHLTVYNVLENYYHYEPDSNEFFELTRHKNLSKQLIKDSDQKLQLIEMNLKAGRLALEFSAFASARNYFRQGIDILPTDSWCQHYALTLTLYKEAHYTAFLNQKHEEANHYFSILEDNVKNSIERAEYYCTYIIQLTQKAEYERAISDAVKLLKDFNITFPVQNSLAPFFSKKVDMYVSRYKGNTVEEIADSFSTLANRRNSAIVKLITSLGGATWFSNIELFSYLMIYTFDFAVKSGYTSGIPYICSGIGAMVAAKQRFQDAELFGKLGVVLAFKHKHSYCRSINNYALCIHPWMAPLKESADWAAKGYQYGLEEGEVEFASYCLFGLLNSLVVRGAKLSSLASETQRAIDYSQRTGSTIGLSCFESVQRYAESLMAKQPEAFSIEETKTFYKKYGKISMGRAYFHLFKMIDLFHRGYYAESRNEAEKIMPDLNQIASFVIANYVNLFHSLAITCECTDHSGFSEVDEAILSKNQKLAMIWSRTFAPTFKHKYDLVGAELARVRGDRLKAMDLYEAAITGARNNGFVHEEALAYELAARFYRNDNKNEIACIYMKNAHRCYVKWQAYSKVDSLEKHYSAWLKPKVDVSTRAVAPTTVDLNTIIKFSQAIAEEIALEKLMTRMMRLVIANAGAQKGFLILKNGAEWVIEAEGNIDKSEVQVLQSIMVESSDALSAGIVLYVARTQKNIVLNDATNEGVFTGDPVIRQRQSKSILCTPLTNQGQVRGILYLENNLMIGAFTSERVELLNLLSSQMAIALDNARLYTNLEDKVNERTQELRGSEANLKEAQHISLIGHWKLDLRENVLEWSDMVYEIFEISPEHLYPSYEGFLELIHPDDKTVVDRAYNESLEKKIPYEIEHRILMTDGRIKWAREICRTDYDQQGKPLRSIGTIQDITENRIISEKLKEAKESAEAANQAKSTFLANMSHEIRTPMNAILGFTEILYNKESDSTKHRQLETIQKSGNALLVLINDILDLSKIEAGKIKLQYTAVSLHSLFIEMETIFSLKTHDKGLKLILELDKAIPQFLILDKIRLRQVFVNLIGNAIKFTENGFIRFAASRSHDDKEREGAVNLCICVEDSGIGISLKDQKQIFGAFEQTNGQKQAQYGSTGLGLTITKGLVELMGGTISIKSDVGEGSIFIINIPHVEIAPEEALARDGEKSVDCSTVFFEPANILIVDDIDYNRELFSTYLSDWEFSILTAKSGKEALEFASQNHLDLILLDMKMPVMDGYEASRLLKRDLSLKDIPIVAITASALKQDEERILKTCDAYLRKPISRGELIQKLMGFLPHRVEQAEMAAQKSIKTEIVTTEGLDEEYLKKIREFSRALNFYELQRISSEIREIDADYQGLCDKIDRLVDEFDFEGILALLDKLAEKRQ